ncbi:MAG: hypothetical protein WCP55_25380 [Lentisphaerota bacterium]
MFVLEIIEKSCAPNQVVCFDGIITDNVAIEKTHFGQKSPVLGLRIIYGAFV